MGRGLAALTGSLIARQGIAEGGPERAGTERANFEGIRRAKSVIVVFANGGQSQLDMWDPKPAAPLEVRGEFNAISTAVPGTLLGEHLPRLAGLADKFTEIMVPT